MPAGVAGVDAWRWRGIGACLLLVLSQVVAPLAHAQRPSLGPQPVELAAEHAVAVPGIPALLTLAPAGRAPAAVEQTLWWPAGVPPVSYGARNVPADVHWIGGRVIVRTGLTSGWLGPVLEWRSVPLDQVLKAPDPTALLSDDGIGFWIIRVELPPDQTRGLRLRVGRRAAPVHWLARPPERVPVSGLPRIDLSLDERDELRRMLAPLRDDPLQRWRLELLADRVPAVREPTGEPDLVLRQLAAQTTARWRAGLAELHRLDPVLAESVIARLTAVVRLPWGTVVPGWASEAASIRTLLSALLARDQTERRLIETARAWLQTEPSDHAWIIDDAAEHGSARIGMANLGSRVATVGLNEGASLVATAQVAPSTVVVVESPAPASLGVARQPNDDPLVTAPSFTVRPPGFDVRALRPDATLVRWLTGESGWLLGSGRVAAHLLRSPDGTRWQIAIEARGEAPVRLWLGPRGRTRARLSLHPNGVREELTDTPIGAAVTREGDRIVTLVEFEPAWSEPDGSILVAIDRRGDAPGAWPRPMLPGQPEPGRARFVARGWAADP
ncbi:MAG: hypothetical protein AAGI30_14205 [Planctomycetota bacterium]